jgi:hypothetical protein
MAETSSAHGTSTRSSKLRACSDENGESCDEEGRQSLEKLAAFIAEALDHLIRGGRSELLPIRAVANTADRVPMAVDPALRVLDDLDGRCGHGNQSTGFLPRNHPR